jgi:hypothetical protein
MLKTERRHYRKPTDFWLKAPVVKGFCINLVNGAENAVL